MTLAMRRAVTCFWGAYRLIRALGLVGSQVRAWMNCRAAACTGHSGLVGRASWCKVASRCPFFWLSRVLVTASACKRVCKVARWESRHASPLGCIFQNCMSLRRIGVVRVRRLVDGDPRREVSGTAVCVVRAKSLQRSDILKWAELVDC
eukprot:scaffold221288_cov60-Attheya_sp.AAC.1